ncbi:hypothetical protein WDU94_007687 [Cyamophila willieti]
MHTRRRRIAVSDSEPLVLVVLESARKPSSSSQPPESIEPLSDSQFERTVLTRGYETQCENTNGKNMKCTRVTRQTNWKCLSESILGSSSKNSPQNKRISRKTSRFQTFLGKIQKSNSESDIISSVAKSPDLNLGEKLNTKGWGDTQAKGEINGRETTENTSKTVNNHGWGETQTLSKFPDDTQTVKAKQNDEQDPNQSNVTNISHGSEIEQGLNNTKTQPSTGGSSTDIENNLPNENENESIYQTCRENPPANIQNSNSIVEDSIVEDITHIEKYIQETSGADLFDTQNSCPEKDTQMVWEDILSNNPGGKNNQNIEKENENVQNLSEEIVTKSLQNLLEGNSSDCVESSLERAETNRNNEGNCQECNTEKSDTRSKTNENSSRAQECVQNSHKRVEESASKSSDEDDDAMSTNATEALTNKENEKLLMFLCYHSFELLDFHNDVIWKRISARDEFKEKSWEVYKEHFFSNLVDHTENYNVPHYFSKHMKQSYVNNSKPGNPARLKIKTDLFPTQKGPNFNNTTFNETSSEKVRTPTKNTNDGASNRVVRENANSEGSQITPSKGPKIKHTTGRHSNKQQTPSKKSGNRTRRSDEKVVTNSKTIEQSRNQSEAGRISAESDFDNSDSSSLLSFGRSPIVRRPKTGKPTKPSPNKSERDQSVESSESSGDNSETSDYNPFKPLTSQHCSKETTVSPSSDNQSRRQHSRSGSDRQSWKRPSRHSGGRKSPSPSMSSSGQRATKRARMTPLERLIRSSDSESEVSDCGSDKLVIEEPPGSSRNKDNQQQLNSCKTKETSRESQGNQSQYQSKAWCGRDSCTSFGSILTPPPSKPKSSVRSSRMPYLSYEKVNMMKYLMDNTSRLNSIKGNVFWKEMEGAGAVPGRTWQSLKNHFFRSMVFELDSYNLEPKFQQRLKRYSAR